MRRHFGAVEADFQSHYGLDLREVLWGPRRFGVRRIHALAEGLPLSGATFRAAATNGQQWTTTDELLAVLVELVDHSNRMYFSTHARKGQQVWKPIQIARPATKVEPKKMEPRKSSVVQMRAAFGENVHYVERSED